jgi:probable rRNA maturation factor
MSTSAAFPAGATLARYTLESVVGRGASGVVYAAYDGRLERRIALKVLSSTLADDRRLRELNRAYSGKDSATNVLSFPAGGEGAAATLRGPARPVLLGDIAVALETTAREAAAAGKPVSDHLAHLLVHGVLHLIGHDHEADQAAEEMEALEVEALARLGVANPYPDIAA